MLEALRSSSWWRRLFAFDVDAPSANSWPWWTGVVVQRRYIRVPASALLWLQSHLFGGSQVAFSCVTLALVVATCLLIYAEAARHVQPWKAALMALVPALHPATSEVVELMNRQPIATSGLFGVVSAICWIRMREHFSPGMYAAALVACALAVTSYEAAIALPFALVLADLCFADQAQPPWATRLGALAVGALYLPLAMAMRRGLVAPDTTSVRPLAEVALALRYDTVAYVLKTVGLINPHAPTSYWFQQRAGELTAIAVSVALLVILAARFRNRWLGWVGLVAFLLLLAPPLLTRATVSVWNFPTFRQLYLPILLGGPLMMAAWLSDERRVWRVCGTIWLAALAVLSLLSAGELAPNGDTAAVARATAALLAGTPVSDTVVGIGDETCRFSPGLIRDGPSMLGIPTGVEDADPELFAAGSSTLVARAPKGFDIPTTEEVRERAQGPGPGPSWITTTPPPLIRDGSQRIPGATVAIAERDGDRITALRYDFERPLADLIFIRFRGCEPPSLATVLETGRGSPR